MPIALILIVNELVNLVGESLPTVLTDHVLHLQTARDMHASLCRVLTTGILISLMLMSQLHFVVVSCLFFSYICLFFAQYSVAIVFFFFFFLMIRRPPNSPLFPSTPLFR